MARRRRGQALCWQPQQWRRGRLTLDPFLRSRQNVNGLSDCGAPSNRFGPDFPAENRGGGSGHLIISHGKR
jgi:hypothetical protein